MYPTDYHVLLNSLSDELVRHGWGSLTLTVDTKKGSLTTKMVIECGKSYVFFVDKKINFNPDEL